MISLGLCSMLSSFRGGGTAQWVMTRAPRLSLSFGVHAVERENWVRTFRLTPHSVHTQVLLKIDVFVCNYVCLHVVMCV